MTIQFSARSRLTLLYTSLFAACGAVLVAVTYALVEHNLPTTKTSTATRDVEALVRQCVANETAKGANANDAKQVCGELYAKGVKAGASAQRSSTLDHLLLYSLLGLAGATVLAAILGWLVAGRILRPIHQLTAAAREASERNLSQRLALDGPRDELRELADTFDDMLGRLDRAFTSQRQFIANASHELRTPLTVMRTSIDVVLAKPKPTHEELISMSTDVRHAVDQAEQLIDALLTLARNEQAHHDFAPLDLADIAEDVLDGRNTQGLTTLTTLDPAPVDGDRVLLERLMGNLLDNAAQYNVPGGTIALSTRPDNGASVLRVVNTGTVIAQPDVQRLFLPFTRMNDRTRHDGFGLGLTLVSSIANVHDGTVVATAVPTGGLDITVRMPRRGGAEPASASIDQDGAKAPDCSVECTEI
jgi:signal transduction histidine kinase